MKDTSINRYQQINQDSNKKICEIIAIKGQIYIKFCYAGN